MMKFCTIIVEVKTNIGFENESRTWPLTRSNWRFYKLYMHRVQIRLHKCTYMSIVPIPVECLHIYALQQIILPTITQDSLKFLTT